MAFLVEAHSGRIRVIPKGLVPSHTFDPSRGICFHVRPRQNVFPHAADHLIDGLRVGKVERFSPAVREQMAMAIYQAGDDNRVVGNRCKAYAGISFPDFL